MADRHQRKPGTNNPTTAMKLHPDYTPTRAAPSAAETVSPPAGEPLERGVVARGRCIDAPDPDAALIKMHASTPNGVNESSRWPTRRHLPGDVVELPASEIARLRELGFIVDPNAVEPVPVPLHEPQQAIGPVPEPRSPAKG